ncbi:MAG: cytochrome c [Candidatus Tectomicrobia bacterium]|nr:cytochrome c [Candidatus Tectomicrobia bacterium]
MTSPGRQGKRRLRLLLALLLGSSVAAAFLRMAAPGMAQARKGDPAKGKAHYQALCAACHGTTGRGDGPAAAALDPKPRNHADGATMNKLSDEHLVTVIKNGGAAVGKSPLMPPWRDSLSDTQVRDVIAYLRALAVPHFKEK